MVLPLRGAQEEVTAAQLGGQHRGDRVDDLGALVVTQITALLELLKVHRVVDVGDDDVVGRLQRRYVLVQRAQRGFGARNSPAEPAECAVDQTAARGTLARWVMWWRAMRVAGRRVATSASTRRRRARTKLGVGCRRS
jgi:hypothetical protein